MKKLVLVLISLFIYSCNEYSKGQFINVFKGTYNCEYFINKKTNQKTIIDSKSVVKFSFGSFRFSILKDNLSLNRKFDSKVNFELTDRNSKKYIWERDIFYNLIDSLTFKEYSIKVHAITKDRENTDELEISNLIEGKYDIAKDTIVYRCKKIE